MLSRIKRPKSPEKKRTSDGVNSLIGGSGVSLDGQSLQIPGDQDDSSMRDEISSVNTSNYGGPSRPIKSFDVINGDEPSMLGDEPSLLGDEPSITAGVPAPSPPKEVSAGSVEDEKSDGGCVPGWMKGAPAYFKVIIVVSIALLVGAIVLVVVAAVMASNDKNNNDGGGSSAQSGINDLTFPPSPPTTPPTSSPTASPSLSAPTISPMPTLTPAPTDFPTESPTEFPTDAPTTMAPTEEGETFPPTSLELTPSVAPSQGSTEATEEITFYVTAGRFQGDTLDDLPSLLQTLPDDGGKAFLVHLGDWNSPFATGCSRESYETVYNLYANSSVPTYFVVGDNEYNDCPDPDEALDLWYEFLLDYETDYWPASPFFVVDRQREDHPENFAFVYQKILFVGINLVGGQVHDQEEWDTRIAANLQWIDDNVNGNSNIEILVVFAHADPDISATAAFFTEFYDRVSNRYNDKHVAFIHRNLGVETSAIEFVQGDFVLLIVEGQEWPPMRIKINTAGSTGFGFDDPEDFDFNQDDWYANDVLSV